MKRAKEFNILFDDVAITHLAFSNEYTKAIEKKQVAQQEAEKARYEVEKQKQEKKAAIIRAEGNYLFSFFLFSFFFLFRPRLK